MMLTFFKSKKKYEEFHHVVMFFPSEASMEICEWTDKEIEVNDFRFHLNGQAFLRRNGVESNRTEAKASLILVPDYEMVGKNTCKGNASVNTGFNGKDIFIKANIGVKKDTFFYLASTLQLTKTRIEFSGCVFKDNENRFLVNSFHCIQLQTVEYADESVFQDF